MKKVTSSDGDEVKSYDEYENFEIGDYEMKDNNNNNGVGGKDNHNDRMNGNNNYNPRFNQYDERSTQTGGNYRRTHRPRNDRYDPWQQQQQQQQQPFNPYQTQLTSPYGDGNNNYLSNNQRADINHNDSNYNPNKSPNDNSTSDKNERDRSCILQCFFQELKMVLNSFYKIKNNKK
jgi:hypothetical protein